MVLAEPQRRGLQDRHGPGFIRTASRGDQNAETAVGVAYEVGAAVHQRNDVLRIAQEVLALGGRAAPVPAPVHDEQSEALLGERLLGLPFLAAGGQRTMREDDLSPAPVCVDEQQAGQA